MALGRAIVRNPKVFLFDEPLSNLDAKMRVQMRSEISRLHAELGSTMIYVTHDQVEAMTMGDRICVMRDGYDHAGGRSADLVSAAGEHVCGRVYWKPADESDQGQDSEARWRAGFR